MSGVPIKLNCWNKRQKRCFFDSFDTLFIDYDGCLWHGKEVDKGSFDFINSLKSMNKTIYYVTNNSFKTRHDLWLKAKAEQFNIEEHEIMAPTNSIANYLKRHLAPDECVYVIGTWAVAKELIDHKIANFGVGPDPTHGVWRDEIKYIANETKTQKVGAVVVGFDPHFSLNKLVRSANFLENNPNSIFMATNDDGRSTFHEYCIPGTGSMLVAIEECMQRKAIVMGKPNPFICQHLVEDGEVNPGKTLMIGQCNKLDTVFGKNCGFQTLLVGSECNNCLDIEDCINQGQMDIIPDYYLNRLGDLGPYYEV